MNGGIPLLVKTSYQSFTSAIINMSSSSNNAQSDIRKSLESIQSLLSQNPKSPMTATSLSSRMHRASLELEGRSSGGDTSRGNVNNAGGGYPSLSPASQQQLRTESSSLQFASDGSGRAGSNHSASNSYYRESRSTSSVSFHPQSNNYNNNIGGVANDRDSSMSYGGASTLQQNEKSSKSAMITSQQGNAKSIIRRSPSSAFSTVNKFSFVGSPPLYGESYGGGGITPLGNSVVLSGALESTSSLSGRAGAATDGSRNILGSSHSDYNNIRSNSRRETSLLVSPVSQHLYQSRSPQSEAVDGGGNPVEGGEGGQQVAHQNQQQQQQQYPPGSAITSPSFPATTQCNNDRSTSLAIHTNTLLPPDQQQHNNGRDPTPYHYRSYPSNSPNQHHHHHNNEDKNKLSDASSRSGRDPPATSASGGNTITMISTMHNTRSSVQNHHHAHPVTTSSSTIGFATNKSTPNVHSHHYQHDGPTELSMIGEEDASLVSNVTGSTFVRTPIVRKLHGGTTTNTTAHHDHHTPRNDAASSGKGGASSSNASASIIHATPSASQLLHRPSLAMRESLSHIATMTSHALEEIWDCVGVASDERVSQLSDLVERIGQLCEMKVQEEEALREQFKKEISEARKEWTEICAALRLINEEDPVAKLKRDPSTRDLEEDGSSGVSLQWEYEAMMERLETLRSIKQSAVSDMQASQSRIFKAFRFIRTIRNELGRTES